MAEHQFIDHGLEIQLTDNQRGFFYEMAGEVKRPSSRLTAAGDLDLLLGLMCMDNYAQILKDHKF